METPTQLRSPTAPKETLSCLKLKPHIEIAPTCPPRHHQRTDPRARKPKPLREDRGERSSHSGEPCKRYTARGRTALDRARLSYSRSNQIL